MIFCLCDVRHYVVLKDCFYKAVVWKDSIPHVAVHLHAHIDILSPLYVLCEQVNELLCSRVVLVEDKGEFYLFL